MNSPTITPALLPPEPELDSGWTIRPQGKQWIGRHPTFGDTLPWDSRLTTLWAARIIESRYWRVLTDVQAIAQGRGDEPPATGTPYTALRSLLVLYMSDDDRRMRARTL